MDDSSQLELDSYRNNFSLEGLVFSLLINIQPEADPPLVETKSIMQKNNKGFAKLFVVMLAVVFGALAVYFLVGRNISPAVQDIAPTVDGVVVPKVAEKQTDTKNPVVDTSNWKTYTSTKYGFSLKYPSAWKVLDSGYDDFLKSNAISFQGGNLGGVTLLIFEKNNDTLSSYLSNMDQKSKTAYEGTPSIEVISSTDMLVDGRAAVQRLEKLFAAGFTTIETYVKNNSNMYFLRLMPEVHGGSSNFSESEKDIYNTILSTFKFTTPGVSSESMTVKVYFAPKNAKQDLCNEVMAVDRITPKTIKVGTAALQELFKGLTIEEKKQGYSTDIPSGTALNSLEIVNGEARVDLNSVAESGGGSCSMSIRTTQISKTLLQFPTVKSVKFSVDGRTNDIFQP